MSFTIDHLDSTRNDFETRIQELSDTQRNELINGDAAIGFDGLEAIFRDYTGDTMFSKKKT